MTDPVSVADFEEHARKILPKSVYDFIAFGATELQTLHDNVQAFRRLRLRPRMLCGVSDVDMSVTVLGDRISMPLGVCPMAVQRMVHDDGEVATAKAAQFISTCMILSTGATISIEEVADAAPRCLKWFQLSPFKNHNYTRAVVQDAERKGFKALVITVDDPQSGIRYRDKQNHFKLPSHLSFKIIEGLNEGNYNNSAELLDIYAKYFTTKLSWPTIDWLKSITRLPIVLKGILTAEDAQLAVEHGVSAIVVSNHGGRQLDGVLATIDALPEVVEAVKGKIEVYLDGGIRTGTDVLKALALGARAVFVGRPVWWGLAYKAVHHFRISTDPSSLRRNLPSSRDDQSDQRQTRLLYCLKSQS